MIKQERFLQSAGEVAPDRSAEELSPYHDPKPGLPSGVRHAVVSLETENPWYGLLTYASAVPLSEWTT